MLARSGQLRERVNEDRLIEFMRMMDDQNKEDSKIVFSRRKAALDDEDDDLLDL